MLLLLALVLSVIAFVYFLKVSPDRFGFTHDDGIYVATAKSLATEQGYRIVSLPHEPAQTKYPPFYSFLLSIVWRVQPEFPGNLSTMMLLSIASALCFLGLTWFYLVTRNYATEWQSLFVVLLVGFNWRTMIVATGIHSEMIFASLCLLALMLADPGNQAKDGWAQKLLLGVILSLVVLTRSAGIALVGAIALFEFPRGLSSRRVPILMGTVTFLAWMGWCISNRENPEQINSAYYTSYMDHLIEVIQDLQSMNETSFVQAAIGILVRNFLMLIPVSIPVVTFGIHYDAAQYASFGIVFILAAFWRECRARFRLLHLFLICYLLLHCFWLPFVSYDRFLLPVLPFLSLFLLQEMIHLARLLWNAFHADQRLVARMSAAVVGLALVACAGIVFHGYWKNSSEILNLAGVPKMRTPAPEDREAMEWIRSNTSPSDTLACYRDPAYFLHTGRKATRHFAMKAGVTWKSHQDKLKEIISDYDVDYLIVTMSDFSSEYQPTQQRDSFRSMLERWSDSLVPVFRSPSGMSVVFQVRTTPNPTS